MHKYTLKGPLGQLCLSGWNGPSGSWNIDGFNPWIPQSTCQSVLRHDTESHIACDAFTVMSVKCYTSVFVNGFMWLVV